MAKGYGGYGGMRGGAKIPARVPAGGRKGSGGKSKGSGKKK